MKTDHHHSLHADPNIAYHFDWGFRREALLWNGDHPIGVNFYPLATELRQWLLREGSLRVFSERDKNSPHSFTNPYTYNSSVIAAILARSVNAAHDFAVSIEPMNGIDADVERIRLYNEQVLYTARFCEAAIKQLLYCTQIPRNYYKNAALGALLVSECQVCKRAKKLPHKISMLGSLGHRYQLCLQFDHCLVDHLKIVNRRRNVEAAHSDTQLLQIRHAAESRSHLKRDSQEIGNELVHMLQHVSDLEANMLAELNARF